MRRICVLVALVVVACSGPDSATISPPVTTPVTTSPTLLPFPDLPTPPALEILEPSDGASFSTSSVRFAGRTDPDCSVSVDGTLATVDAAGSWDLDLSYEAGAHTATVAAVDQAGTTAVRQVSFTIEQPALGYYRFDDSGLYRVLDGQTVTLVEGPITWVADDRLGGVLYSPQEGPVEWLRSGAPDGVVFHLRGEVGILEGRPIILRAEYDPTQCPEHEYYWGEMMVSIDLTSGVRTPLFCDRDGPDGGVSFEAVRDELIVGVGWESWGPDTDHAIYFFDASGAPVDVPTNPFPTSCAPCELAARLSPDGSLLAYRHRPDAYWPEEVPQSMSREAWVEKTEAIPGEVVVIILADGSELFRTGVAARTRLVDFDGRRVVVWNEQTGESTIYDISGTEATVVTGQVALMQPPLEAASTEPFLLVTRPVPGATSRERALRFEGITDPGVRVVAGGRYAADVDAAGNWSVVLMLEPGTNVATFVATEEKGVTATVQVTVVYLDPIELDGTGLGIAEFGDLVEPAMEALTGALGRPTDDLVQLGPFDGLVDGYMADDYFRTVAWSDHGLEVIFSDGEYYTDAGAHLVGWRYQAADRATFTTPRGMGIGTTVAEVTEMYQDEFVAVERDVCIDIDFSIGAELEHSGLILGWLDGSASNPSAQVIRLAAGAWPEC